MARVIVRRGFGSMPIRRPLEVSGPRIACLLVPDLPLRAELRAHPELAPEPLVIASGRGSQADVIAVSPSARAMGVQAWSSVPQARATAPELLLRTASPALETAARDALLDVALSCSPRAVLAPPATGFFVSEGAVFVDAAGMQPIFASERGFASALGARAEAHGLPGVVAITRSRSLSLLVARRIAHEAGAVQVLEPEQEQAFLAPLPLDLLDPSDHVAQVFTQLGVYTIRDLLGLSRKGLAKRFGRDVLELIDRAMGRGPELPLPEPTQRCLEEAIDLEAAIHQLEPLRFVLRGLLSRLIERLSLRALACHQLEITLVLEDGRRDVRHIGLAAPTLDIRVLLRLLMLSMEERPPTAPIEALCLGSEGCPLSRDQLDLFRPPGPDPIALDQTLSDLESLCGEGRVGTPVVTDTHLPTAFAVKPFVRPPPRTQDPSHSGRASARLAVRALRPPVPAEVRIERGLPAHVRSALTHGQVQAVSGPWRSTGHWWNERTRFAVDHYDVQMEDGTVARLCFDWVRKNWLIDGVYD